MISYLGSPYSHPSPAIRRLRFEHAVIAAAHFMRQGKTIFCPIAHSHDIGLIMPEDYNTHEFWMGIDMPFLSQSEELIVLTLDGWRDSRGLAEEIAMAQSMAIPVTYVMYDPAWEKA